MYGFVSLIMILKILQVLDIHAILISKLEVQVVVGLIFFLTRNQSQLRRIFKKIWK